MTGLITAGRDGERRDDPPPPLAHFTVDADGSIRFLTDEWPFR